MGEEILHWFQPFLARAFRKRFFKISYLLTDMTTSAKSLRIFIIITYMGAKGSVDPFLAQEYVVIT